MYRRRSHFFQRVAEQSKSSHKENKSIRQKSDVSLFLRFFQNLHFSLMDLWFRQGESEEGLRLQAVQAHQGVR